MCCYLRLVVITMLLSMSVSAVFAGDSAALAACATIDSAGDPGAGAGVLSDGAELTDTCYAPAEYAITGGSSGSDEVRLGENGAFSKPIRFNSWLRLEPTGITRVILAEDILHLATRGFTEVAGLQVGVMQLPGRTNTHAGPVSVRAGFPDETGCYVDGLSLRDPATGELITPLNNNTIESVKITNQAYDASFGNVLSGTVEVSIKPGEQSKWRGIVEAVTDNLHGDNFDYNIYSTSLSGPVIRGSRPLYFQGALERGWAGDAGPRSVAGGILPNHSSSLWNWQAKLIWNPVQSMQLSAGTIGADQDRRLFSMPFYFNREHTPRMTRQSSILWGALKHDISVNTQYRLRVNWFSNETEIGDGVHFDDIWAYSRPDGNVTFDETYLFWSGDNPNTLSARDHEVMWDPMYGYGYITIDGRDIVVRDEYGNVRNGRYREDVDSVFAMGGWPWDPDLTVRDDERHVIYADEGWVYEDYEKRKTTYTGFYADVSHAWTADHTFTGGAEYRYHTLQYYRHLFPHVTFKDSIVNGLWYRGGGFDDVDHYGYDAFGNESDTLSAGTAARHPHDFSFYLQDKANWKDFAVSFGLRYDYYNANIKQLRFPKTPLGDPDDGIGNDNALDSTDFAETKGYARLSPRLGLAIQLREGTAFHFSYGRFIRRPDFQYLYSSWDMIEYRLTSAGYFYPLGNASLSPIESRAYEFGLIHQLRDYVTVGFTAFYREVNDAVTLAYRAVTPGAAGRDYQTYASGGEARIRGLEIQLDLRQTRSLSTQFNYTLLDAQAPITIRSTNIVWTVSEAPVTEYLPMALDRRHNFTGIVDFRIGPREGPALGDFYPFERSGFNVVLRAGSGFPYSPMETYNEITLAQVSPSPSGPIHSERTPTVYRFDLKLDKKISFAGAYLDFYLWIVNVFDGENAIDVYQSSGQSNNTGWLSTESGQNFQESSTEPDWTGLNGVQKYHLRQADPFNYDTPRQIRFGMRLGF